MSSSCLPKTYCIRSIWPGWDHRVEFWLPDKFWTFFGIQSIKATLQGPPPVHSLLKSDVSSVDN